MSSISWVAAKMIILSPAIRRKICEDAEILSIVFVPPATRPTRPEQCMLPATVPATTRLLIVAPLIAENGAR